MGDTIRTVREFGIVLVEKQHNFFLDESIDNSEHVPAIKRIADCAYEYLKCKGEDVHSAEEVEKELIDYGEKLFIEAWMTSEEGEDPSDEEDRLEAIETFEALLEESHR